LKGDGFKISVQQQDMGEKRKYNCVAWFYAKSCMVEKNKFENELYSTHLVVDKVQPCAKPHGFVTWFDFSFRLYIYIYIYSTSKIMLMIDILILS
jgi:hypothetical protein